MPAKLETIGTYLFAIGEAGVNVTQSGKPQFVARLKAVQKFVENPEEIKHFQGQGLLADGNPGYVDWSAFDEEITAFLLLFNSADTFDENTAMKNYEQLQKATGWDGTSFDTLGEFNGVVILGRVQEKKPYTNSAGKEISGGLEVAWIDSKDADPVRQLRTIGADEIKNLNAKLKITKTAKPAVPAKPVASVAAPTKPTAAPASAPSAPSTTAPTVATPPSTATAQPVVEQKPARAKKAPKTPPAPAPVAVAAAVAAESQTTLAGLPAESTMEEAWEAVNVSKGDNEDQVVEEAWLSACSEVAEGKDAATLTPVQWAKVRDITLKDLAA